MVMESGFSSPRAIDSFPAGLRVLVVDDDPTWLKILEKMLKKCNYDVTTCGLAREALKLLRERKDGYDIVISDVNMPDMDGFKLLEHVGLEMDLPVIMMSVDGETSRVMKGVQHGACDYLLKPIRMKELKNIWQHVFRKRMVEVRDIESYDSVDDINLFRNAADLTDDGHFFSGGDQMFLKKRKDMDKYGDNNSNDSSSAKKPRVVWSVDLHQKFVKAVNQIGFDKVGPKKILDLMNVSWLTRENVASHLQKYRLYLSRLQKENELKSACGSLKNMEHSSKDVVGGFVVHNSTSVNMRCPDYKLPVQSADAKKPNEMAPKGISLSPFTEPRKQFNSNLVGPHKRATATPPPPTTSSPKIGFDHSLGSLKPDISYTSFECPVASQFTWSEEVQDSHFKFECKPQQQQQVLEMPFECKSRNRLEDIVQQQLIQDDLQQQTTCFNNENIGFVDSKLLGDDINNGLVEQPFLIGQGPEMFAASTLPDMNQSVSQDGLLGLESGPSNHILCSESVLGSWSDDLGFYIGDQFTATTSNEFGNLGFPDYAFPGLVNEASPMCFYGAPRYEFEHQNESMEYAVVDQGLSIS